MATISQQLNELINQKSQLAANLNTKGVVATSNEKLNTLVPKVLEIETGIDTSDATAISSDIKEGKTAYVNGVKITGDAYTRGTVDAVVDGKKHYLKAGFYEGINIPEDADLLPENIRSGVEIYGTTGTLENLDTSDATATAAEIREGYTAYVNGQKIVGTIPSYGANTYIPTTEDQRFEPGSYITGVQIVKGDANLVSDNIKAGIEIFGVAGNPNVIDTTVDEVNTASTTNMLKDTIAFVNGTKIIGSCESMADTVITPSTENQTITGPKILQGNKTIQILGDANLIPENIKSDVSIFNVAGTYSGSGSSGLNEKILLDCRSMSSSNEVYNAYTDIVMVSNDGAYATFSNLSDYIDYQTIAAIYQQELAGINICTGVSNTGFYFTVPIAIQSSHALFKLIYFVSTWINPSIQLNFILADSIDEIPNKIATGDIAWSKSITLANANNKQSSFFEFTDLPIGTYYLFISMPTTVGGNEGIMNCISLINF